MLSCTPGRLKMQRDTSDQNKGASTPTELKQGCSSQPRPSRPVRDSDVALHATAVQWRNARARVCIRVGLRPPSLPPRLAWTIPPTTWLPFCDLAPSLALAWVAPAGNIICTLLGVLLGVTSTTTERVLGIAGVSGHLDGTAMSDWVATKLKHGLPCPSDRLDLGHPSQYSLLPHLQQSQTRHPHHPAPSRLSALR